MQKRLTLLLLFLSVALSACALHVHVPPNPANPIYTVAVLPPYNATNDIDGPAMVRDLVDRRLHEWHYNNRPLKEVDEILRDQMGITLGSQLDLTTPQQLGATLGVDGLIYIYMLNFDDITTGVYNVKKVRAGVKLLDAKSGRVVWAHGQGVKTELISGGAAGVGIAALKEVQEGREGLEPYKTISGIQDIPHLKNWHIIAAGQEKDVGRAAMLSLGEKLVTKAVGAHLRIESNAMLNMIFSDFPAGPGAPRAYAAAPANIPMPKIEVPGGGLVEYAGAGKRDFTADVMMTVYRQDSAQMVVYGKLAKGGDNLRSDMDMTTAVKDEGKDVPKGLLKPTHITRAGEKRGYMVYTELKKYIEEDLTEAGRKSPSVEKKKVGSEVVDGHPSDKFEVTFTDWSGATRKGYMWEARDLDRFVVKADMAERDSRVVVEFKNVRLVTPPASLFQVPPDYVRAANFMELVADKNPGAR